MSAIILTGSPVAGRFAFPKRVDYIRLPGVTKKSDGSYVSETLGLDIEETTALRSGLIKSAVEIFDPDLFIASTRNRPGSAVNWMPALHWLKRNSPAKLVLGLRDVLDEPDVLAAEWSRARAQLKPPRSLYHDIWVYGLESIYDPTIGLNIPQTVRDRMHFTGYIRRKVTKLHRENVDPFILITPGGGGDGEAILNLVLSAYEQDPDLSPRAVLVYGPFLSADTQDEFETRAEKLNGRVHTLGFESKIENLFAQCAGRDLRWVATTRFARFCPSTSLP